MLIARTSDSLLTLELARHASRSWGAPESPLVSVVIPVFNSAATIECVLDSVAAQTYRPLEIIVVDDCSNDDTVRRVREWRTLPVKLYRQSRNHGPSRTRNAGIAAATGDYVAFLDSDDIWHPDKLAKQMARFAANPRATLVACRFRQLDQRGNRVALEALREANPVGPDAWKALLKRSWVQTSCVVAPRATLLAVGGFDEGLVVAEDQDLWIKLTARGEIEYVGEELSDFIMSPNSYMPRHQGYYFTQLVPMIERHVAANRARLTFRESNEILGCRYCKVGRALYEAGDRRGGRRYIMRGMVRGHAPLKHAWYLVCAIPTMRKLKRRVADWCSAPAPAFPPSIGIIP
jgi:glycosyltransferase involved in cell wall biosynthesis